MSNSGLIIEERSRDIGDFLVGRLIPFRKKRMVGPFVFIDHMGPTHIRPNHYLDVDQHPHIGIATLTYLLEGTITHQDSMGTNQIITPGSVNWMVAGKGCTHTERTPQAIRDAQKSYTLHGYQIWVALPKALENIAPSFQHIEAVKLPKWTDKGAQYILVAGNAMGHASPLSVHSPLFMIDLKAHEDYPFTAHGLKGEIGITIVKGSIQACNQTITAGNMLVSKTQDLCNLLIHKGSQVLIFGGTPFAEKRHIFWNFVSHDLTKIEMAKNDWVSKKIPMMSNDQTYIPLPKSPRSKLKR